MRAYELMIIFDGDVEDTAVNEHLANVGRLIEAGGGTVVKTDRWGRRRFAYEINHKWEGIYVVLDISTEGRDLSVEGVLVGLVIGLMTATAILDDGQFD